MADVKQTRRTIIIALAAMLCIDAICVGILVSPIGRASREGRQNEEQLWTELQNKTRETIPLHGIDGKIQNAKLEIQDFYAQRIPTNFAKVPETLGKLASENGVTVSAAHYTTEDMDIPGVRMVRVQAAIDGDYLKEAKFINAVERERDQAFFIIDSVALGEQQKGGVRLQIILEAYIRNQAS